MAYSCSTAAIIRIKELNLFKAAHFIAVVYSSQDIIHLIIVTRHIEMASNVHVVFIHDSVI